MCSSDLTLLPEAKTLFTARVDPRSTARPRRALRLAVDPSRFHFFEPTTGASILSGEAARPETPEREPAEQTAS